MSQQTHFYSLNSFLRERHGEKVMKLSLDGGFTCPNRDGRVGFGGCIFCSSLGSGDFATPHYLPIKDQLEDNITLLSRKWPSVTKYFAYFQSYSNTYAPVDVLRSKFEEALAYPNVVGLAIGTRPDCLPPDIISYLEDLNTRTHLWVELGLQSIHTHTSQWMNRGHSLKCFEDAVYLLHSKKIEVVAHMILGLPGETREDMLATAKYLATLPLQGVKIHMLHVVDNAPLGKAYLKQPFPLLTEDEYISVVGDILKVLPSHFVIHRLTGDGDRKHLIAPLWTIHKTNVLNHIQKYLRTHRIFQGRP